MINQLIYASSVGWLSSSLDCLSSIRDKADANGPSSFVNSMGNINFVESPFPISFKVSKYCKLSVLVSIFRATEYILSKAVLKPSARRTEAC